jgi:NADH:ubiquinone oxidoreductase subunit 4 (subunit M)
VSIIYATLTALRQVDLKKIIAYSSVAHMGYVVLGLFCGSIQGIDGAVFTYVKSWCSFWRSFFNGWTVVRSLMERDYWLILVVWRN